MPVNSTNPAIWGWAACNFGQLSHLTIGYKTNKVNKLFLVSPLWFSWPVWPFNVTVQRCSLKLPFPFQTGNTTEINHCKNGSASKLVASTKVRAGLNVSGQMIRTRGGGHKEAFKCYKFINSLSVAHTILNRYSGGHVPFYTTTPACLL